MPNFQHFLQLPIATDKVRYVGEPIAVVVAESRYVAEDASRRSRWTSKSAADLDLGDGEPGDTLIHQRSRNRHIDRRGSAAATRKLYSRAPSAHGAPGLQCQRHAAVPMERAGLSRSGTQDARMTVLGITKVPFFNRTLLSEMLGLPEKSVVMKVADAGGGFGVRGEFYPEDFLVPYLARRLDRPVKWIEDRWEHFLATNAFPPGGVADLEIACDRDGTIVRLRGEVAIDIGAYARGTGGTAPTRCAQFLPGPYRIPNFACKVSAYLSNKTPAEPIADRDASRRTSSVSA